MSNENINNGVIFVETTETDYVVGTATAIGYEEVLPSGDWTPYLPADELQNIGMESMGCVSFSAANCLETQLNRYLIEDLIPDNLVEDLRLAGFIKDGLFNFSDRFLAKMSGTTSAGNSLPNVWSAIRHYGMVGEADWASDWTSWSAYYKGIPQEVKTKALRFLDYFSVQNEYLVNNKKLSLDLARQHIKQCPLQVATATCPGWSYDDVIKACNWGIAHATEIYHLNGYYDDFDTYSPFKKKLSGNYNIPLAMKGVVVPRFELKKKTNSPMAKLTRKKNTKEVFLTLGNERYWIKDVSDFDNIVKEQPIVISWQDIQEVDSFSDKYDGRIVGQANLSDALRILFGKVS